MDSSSWLLLGIAVLALVVFLGLGGLSWYFMWKCLLSLGRTAYRYITDKEEGP